MDSRKAKVMVRVHTLIQKQDSDIRDLLRGVLEIERSYMSESGSGAIPKIEAKIRELAQKLVAESSEAAE